eukprot:PLAT3146.1.p1 GENE.PLAT3146.1~~PLAT3146.1.p1  ORF type:complete len:625 (-),score=283.99 PLAT3146.1:108-1982(-)
MADLFSGRPPAWLADVGSGKKYTYMTEPRMPLPSLRASCEQLLRFTAPLLSEEEAERSRQVVEDFLAAGGVGDKVTAKLEERAEECKKSVDYPNASWLASLWDTYGYLCWRDPVAIFINYFGTTVLSKTRHPIRRLSRILHSVAHFKQLVDADELEPDYADRKKTRQLCHWMYRRLLSTTRIPTDSVDRLETFEGSRHVVVLRRNRMYRLDVLDATGTPYSALALEPRLRAIREEADAASPVPPIAVLTADDRGEWARTRERLRREGGVTQDSLEVIERAICFVVMDEAQPEDGDDAMRALQCGRSGRNRWFDKSLSLIAFDNGIIGTNEEHTATDAGQMVRLMRFAYWYNRAAEEADAAAPGGRAEAPLPASELAPPAQELRFAFTPALRRDIARAGKCVDALIADNVLLSLPYDGYGSAAVKVARLSPDAFVQMALQLAFFRDQGRFCATYETGLLRTVYQGRTETVHGMSTESCAFVHGFESRLPRKEKLALLRAAIAANRKHSTACARGAGFDRHLLAAKVTAAREGWTHDFFTDAALTRNFDIELSTSQVTSIECLPGFGAPFPNSYGVGYSIFGRQMLFTVSSRRSCKTKDAHRFYRTICGALDDMRSLLMPVMRAKL